MENIIQKGFSISGTDGVYQYILTILLFFFGASTNICYAGLFLMETAPLVKINKSNDAIFNNNSSNINNIKIINNNTINSLNYLINYKKSHYNSIDKKNDNFEKNLTNNNQIQHYNNSLNVIYNNTVNNLALTLYQENESINKTYINKTLNHSNYYLLEKKSNNSNNFNNYNYSKEYDKNYVQYDSSIVTINYDICLNNNYTIETSLTKHTWVYDYNIYCNKFKTSLIGFFYCIGCILGALMLQYYNHRIGPKNSILINGVLFAFFSIILITFTKSLFVLYISITGFGYSSIAILVLKVAYLSEITSTKVRPFLNNIILSANSVTLMIVYFLFENNFHWKTIYLFNFVILFCVCVCFYLIAVDSPRYLVNKKKYSEYIISVLKIHYINKKKENGCDTDNQKVNEFIDYFVDKIPNLKELLNNTFNNKTFEISTNVKNTNFVSYQEKITLDNVKAINLNSYDTNKSNSSLNVVKSNDSNYINILNSNEDKKSLKCLDEEKFYLNNVNNNIYLKDRKKINSFVNLYNINNYQIQNLRIQNNKLKLMKYNFVITFGLINFLSFVFNISMKEYSYYFHSKFYLSCLISMMSSIPLSYLMNTFGRLGTKVALLLFFITVVYLKALNIFSIQFIIVMFLLNKLLVHLIYMVHHTHLNESFSCNIRIVVGSWAFILGKIFSVIAQFMIEYLHDKVDGIMLIISCFLIILIFQQTETREKELSY